MNRQVKNLQGIGNFFPGFQSRPLDPKDFCMEATGTPLQRVGFPGARPVAATKSLRFSLFYKGSNLRIAIIGSDKGRSGGKPQPEQMIVYWRIYNTVTS